MKKKIITTVATMAICLSAVTGVGNYNVYADGTTTATEESEQSLSAYEKFKLAANDPEKLEKYGCDKIVENKDCLFFINDEVLMQTIAKDDKVTEIVVPKEVKSVWHDSFLYTGCAKGATIVFHEDMESIGYLSFCCAENIGAIVVAEGSEKYCSVDGVLYSKDMKTLIAYPREKKDTTYIVPESVEDINVEAFSNNSSLKMLQLGENIHMINGKEFSFYEKGVWYLGNLEGSLLKVYISNNEGLKGAISSDENCRIITGTIEESLAEMANLINGGDLDGDKQVTLADAQIALKVALHIEELPDLGMSVAAASEQKNLTISDAKMILEYALGIR